MCAKKRDWFNGIKFAESRPLITDRGPLIFPGATRFQAVNFSEAGNDILAGGCGGQVWLYRRLAKGGDPMQPVFEKIYLCRIPTYIGTPVLVSDGILVVDGEPLTFMVNTNTSLSCGDIDGDGVPEILLRTNKHGHRIIKNIGTAEKPVFTMSPQLELKAQGEFYLGDVNGDGLADLISGGGEIGYGVCRLNLTKKGK